MKSSHLVILSILFTFSFNTVQAVENVIVRPVTGEYTSYKLDLDKVSSSAPALIGAATNTNRPAPSWKGLRKKNIHAAFIYPRNNRIYLFSGRRYYRFNAQTNKIDRGYPKRTGVHGWRGLWKGRIDAVMVSPNKKKVYFFKGKNYIRWDVDKDRKDPGYPKQIGVGGWSGLWTTGIDAAVTHPVNNRVYFFKGNQYIRYRFGYGVDAGYPKVVGEGGWKGLYPDITAALALDNNRIDFFHHRSNAALVANHPKMQPGYQGVVEKNDARIHEYYTELLNGAKPYSTVRIMIGAWNKAEMVQPIADAIDRLVDVKIIANNYGPRWLHVSKEVEDALAAAGIKSRVCNWRSKNIDYLDSLGYMNINHAKLLLFSDVAGKNVYGKKLVINSSSNWLNGDTSRPNDSLTISDTRLYLYHLKYFQDIWDVACEGKQLPANTVFGKVLGFSGGLSAGFFPASVLQSSPPDPVLQVIDSVYCGDGKGKIRMAASKWSLSVRGRAIRDAIVRKRVEGCDVRVIAEGYRGPNTLETNRSLYDTFQTSVIGWAKTRNHSKYLIAESYRNGVAKYIVIMGALNFSSGLRNTGEYFGPMLDSTLTVKDNKALYRSYLANWERVWNTATDSSNPFPQPHE